jgi:translocation and assembly module TamB
VSEANGPKKKRRFKWSLAIAGSLLLAGFVALVVWLNSDGFRNLVRARVVAQLERMTGGSVELESFTWNLSRLNFEARGLTIHGLEPAGEEPYIHADRISLRLRIISLLWRKISLEEVAVEKPTVHLIIDSGAITNQPRPKATGSEGSPTQSLFDLAVKQVKIADGTLVLNRDRTPFEFQGDRLSAALSYSRQENGYTGDLAFSVAAARLRNNAAPPGKIEANFVLRSTETEFKSLTAESGRSRLRASGLVRNYSHPQVQMKYAASLDLVEAARQSRIPELQAGIAEVTGDFSWQDGRFSSQGNLTARDVGWRDPSWRVSAMEVASPFSVTEEKIDLSHITARVFHGGFQGDLQIENWSPASIERKSLPLRGSAHLRFSGFNVRELAAAVSTARMPVDKIEMVGSASGEVAASWTGSLAKLTAEVSAGVTPPANPLPQQVPVTAQVRATYHGDLRTLNVATLNLATRSIHATASGQLGSRTAQARLSATATDLHELQPALDALKPGTIIPITVNGRAAFEGSVFGDLKALAGRGHVDLENFSSDFSIGGTNATPRHLTWASLTADLEYSPSNLNLQHGVLRRGKSQFGFSFNAGLHEGSLDPNLSQLKVDLHAENAALEDLQILSGVNVAATGTATADLHITGTPRNLQGGGNLQIQKLTAYGEVFPSVRSQIRFAGQEVQFNNLVAIHNGAQLAGSVVYDARSQGVRFDLTGSNFDLANVRSVQFSRFAIEGKGGFHVSGSLASLEKTIGAGNPPVLNGYITIANLVVNREAVGNFTATVETRSEQLVLHGRSVFEDASLDFGGTVQMRGDFPTQITAQFAHLDIDPVLRGYLPAMFTGHSSVEGSLEIRGPAKRPRDLIITGKANAISLNVANIKLQNDAPIVFSMDREVLRINPFHLVGQDTELFMNGSLGVAADHALDVHTRGRLDLKLAQLFNPNILAYGPAKFSVDVSGTIARPTLAGRVELSDAAVSLADLPNGLSHIQGTMVFAQDRIQIEKLTALSGGGELNVGGFLAYRNGLYFDLTATGRDVRLRYPPGISSSASANLRYTGSSKSSLLSGDITITRFSMNPRFDFAVALAQSNKAPVLSTMNPFLENLRLDVHIASAQELHVETSLARLSGDVDLRLRGTAARPSVLGRVTIAEGDIFFNGTKFRLERGDVTFSNPLVMEPVVNIEMSARVQNYDITVGLHGTLSGGRGLSLTYRSDPPLSNSDIIALLAFGRTQGQDVYNASQPGQNPNDVSTASNAVLGEALNAAVNDRVERIFGGSRVRVDPQFIGSENNPSARVTIEQSIKNNITLTYVTNVSQSSQTVIQFEYNINKDLSIVGVRDQNGVVSFNVSIRRRKK